MDSPAPDISQSYNSTYFGLVLALFICVVLAFVSAICFCNSNKNSQSQATTNNTRTPSNIPRLSGVESMQAEVVQHKGLNAETISTFPEFACALLTPTTGCSVCLADYINGEMLRMLPVCAHLIHRTCIDKWLVDNFTCPICRSSLQPLDV